MSTYMSLDCDGFAAQLADYLDGDAPDAVRDAVESHAASCAACRQLLDDLSALRHDAAALPLLVPSRDLWDGIAERIDARVIPMAPAARTVRTPRRTWMRPGIAAAALIVVTAGVTHLATRMTLSPDATSARPVASNVIGDSAAGAPSGSTALERSLEPSHDPSTAARTAAAPAAPATLAGRGGREATATRSAAGGAGEATQPAAGARLASTSPLMQETEPVYDQEIIKLRRLLQTRRAELDPRTIAVLEQSMAVIDSAIAQSRSALAKDPASGFLATQLNQSLGKKVELLRTAAMLPART